MQFRLKRFNLKVISQKNGLVKKKKKFNKPKNKSNKDGIQQLILSKEFPFLYFLIIYFYFNILFILKYNGRPKEI